MATSIEFIKNVATATEMTQRDVKEMSGYFEEELKKTLIGLKDGESFKFAGLTFSVKDIPAREVRNPKTGEKKMADPTRKAIVKMSKPIKDCVK